MQFLKRAVWLCAAFVLPACGGPEEAGESEALAQQEQALTSGTSQGCAFSIGHIQIPFSQPPRWQIYLSRSSAAPCPYGQGSLTLGYSYSQPSISLAANNLGVATGFAYKGTPSGSGNIQCRLNHIDPATMTSVRGTDIVVNFGAGNVNSCNLAIASNGTTLTAGGTKTGPLPGETGSGNNYVATYVDFFTSTTAPTYFAY